MLFPEASASNDQVNGKRSWVRNFYLQHNQRRQHEESMAWRSLVERCSRPKPVMFDEGYIGGWCLYFAWCLSSPELGEVLYDIEYR